MTTVRRVGIVSIFFFALTANSDAAFSISSPKKCTAFTDSDELMSPVFFRSHNMFSRGTGDTTIVAFKHEAANEALGSIRFHPRLFRIIQVFSFTARHGLELDIADTLVSELVRRNPGTKEFKVFDIEDKLSETKEIHLFRDLPCSRSEYSIYTSLVAHGFAKMIDKRQRGYIVFRR